MPELSTLSASMQDYLEAILELEDRGNLVRITDIANKLRIAKASVKQTTNKLKDNGLVRQNMYGPVELTLDGRDVANKVIERHRKLQYFLKEVLGVDAGIAEKDACLMEHAVSKETMERLTNFLCKNGYVEDPDGKGVRSLDMVKKSLDQLEVDEKGRVVRVASKGAMRRRIMEMGVVVGTEIIVKGFAPLGDPMELGIMGYSLSLRKSEAAEITVELI